MVEVLKQAKGPMLYTDIKDLVAKSGYKGSVPGSVYSHLYARAQKGMLKFEGNKKFALA